jgi:hypothetical protein
MWSSARVAVEAGDLGEQELVERRTTSRGSGPCAPCRPCRADEDQPLDEVDVADAEVRSSPFRMPARRSSSTQTRSRIVLLRGDDRGLLLVGEQVGDRGFGFFG